MMLIGSTPLISYFSDIKYSILALFILIFIDLLTGIRKYHFKRKIKLNLFKRVFWYTIKSYLLRQTWKKSYEYIFGILAVFCFEMFIFGKSEIEILGKNYSFTKWIIVLASIVEIWSIFENLEKVSGNNLLKKCLSFFPEKIKKIFYIGRNKE